MANKSYVICQLLIHDSPLNSREDQEAAPGLSVRQAS